MDTSADSREPTQTRPHLRIWLCGPFRMEWIDLASGQTVPAADSTTGSRDRAAALSLLALLLCQPNRQAHRDWVMEQFWPEGRRDVAVHRLENIFSCLRKLLRPPSGGESLVRSSIGKKNSGTSYCLEPYPTLWMDCDALVWNIEQACRMERFGDDPLPFWQRAFDLLKRGPFLVDDPYEPYASWVKEQREVLQGYYRQCVHALARLYISQAGEAGKAETLLVLRTYWQQAKTDQDALRPLLELLGEQERYQEAEEYYQQLLLALAELGSDENGQSRTPDQRTRDISEYLRTKQIRRERAESLPSRQNMPHSSIEPSFSISHAYSTTMHPSPTLSQGASTRSLSNGQVEKFNVSSLLGLHSSHTLESGIVVMKEDRRRFLQDMLNFAGITFTAPQALFDITSLQRLAEVVTHPSRIDDFTLTQLETITRSHWHLFLHAPSKSNLLSSFWGHLQTILQLLKYPQQGAICNRLYSIAGESAQMIGEILFDMQEYQHAQTYYNFSIYAAKEAGNNALRSVGLGRLSFLPIYRDEPLQAYPLLEEAKQLLSSVSRPMISSWLAVVEAEMLAHLRDEVACEKALERAIVHSHQGEPEEDRLWTRLNDATIPGYQGACYLQLQQPQKALVALQDTLTYVPEYSPRHRSLILADMAAAMQQMEEIEGACTHLHNALEITTQTKSLMVLMRIQRVRKNLEPWKEVSYLKQLDTSISELLPSIIA